MKQVIGSSYEEALSIVCLGFCCVVGMVCEVIVRVAPKPVPLLGVS